MPECIYLPADAMPITYHIDKALGTIHTRCSGDLKFDEVMDHFRALRQDPDCPERLDVLLDVTGCTSSPQSDQLRSAGAAVGKIREKVRFDACAIIVSDDLWFGMARMFLAFAEGHFRVSQVFRNLDEGKKWLASVSAD